MNVLILGSGGREHALAWKISGSPLLDNLYIAPGNAGTALHGHNTEIDVSDFAAVGRFALKKQIDMLIVGPEEPLVRGIADFFEREEPLHGISVIGPGSEGAKLEGSKEYAKRFMQRHHIPTAEYAGFDADHITEGLLYLEKISPPYVLKADGLAAGKGVLILDDLKNAKAALNDILLGGKFGNAGKKLIIEEYLQGIELSVFIVTDGQNYCILPEAKDYKRAGEGDSGLNTGGMGAVSPVPFADQNFMQKVQKRIIKPTVEGLKKEGITYKGFLFFGLMNVSGNPYVIEYNVRLGDPETEVILPRIKSDLLKCLKALSENRLTETDISFHREVAATVILVSGGYPASYEKGKLIAGLDRVQESLIFHAGTKKDQKGQVITNGGRVLALTSLAGNMETALNASYRHAETITFERKYYRKDIGFDLK